MNAHKNAPRFRDIEIAFEVRPCTDMDGAARDDPEPICNYCGSLSVEAMLKYMQTPGVHYSGSDWKYGYPHKFYVDVPCTPYRRCTSAGPGKEDFGYSETKSEHRKFYSEHLEDATPEQIDEWNRVCAPLLGVQFFLNIDGHEGLAWKAVPGWQSDGVVA